MNGVSDVPAPAPGPVDMKVPGALLAGLVALWLAMNELSLLSAGFLAKDGTSWSFNGVSGPLRPFLTVEWNGVLDSSYLSDWKQLLVAYTVLDVYFIIGYVVAVLLFTSGWTWVRWFILAIAAVDAVETMGMLVLGLQRCPDDRCVPSWGSELIAVFTSIKWTGIVLVALLVGLIGGVKHWSEVRRFGRLLRIQRFSLVAFLPIAVLATVPGSSVFDQLPDVQRRWLDGGLGHAGLAALFYLVLLFVLFVLGRIRADWALRRVRGKDYCWPYFDADKQPREPTTWLWLVGPLVLVVVAFVLALVDRGTVFWVKCPTRP